MQTSGAPCGAPTGPDARAMVHEIVDALQFARQQFVVMAEFKQLRVGVFEQLHYRFRSSLGVVEKCSVPADYRQVVRIVRDLRLHDLLLLAIREWNIFAAHDLGNASALRREKLGRRWITRDLAHVEDKVIFMQPSVIELYQRRPS